MRGVYPSSHSSGCIDIPLHFIYRERKNLPLFFDLYLKRMRDHSPAYLIRHVTLFGTNVNTCKPDATKVLLMHITGSSTQSFNHNTIFQSLLSHSSTNFIAKYLVGILCHVYILLTRYEDGNNLFEHIIFLT